MQRKLGFPAANCNIKMPDAVLQEEIMVEDNVERRQQLVNFGHSQWGFNNWSWSVTKQEIDFVDFTNGKYAVGVVAFVSVTQKTFDIHRENIGYATCLESTKGSAIYRARKCAVTNALKETLLSFGGSVTTELTELLQSRKEANNQAVPRPQEVMQENNQNLANKPPTVNVNVDTLLTSVSRQVRKDSLDNARLMPSVAPPPVPVATPQSVPANHQPVQQPPPANQLPRVPPSPNQHVRPKSNDGQGDVGVGSIVRSVSDAEARAERKRRQKMAQELFRQRQLLKQLADDADGIQQELHKNSIDSLLLEIPSQGVDVPTPAPHWSGQHQAPKRKSPEPATAAKRPDVRTEAL